MLKKFGEIVEFLSQVPFFAHLDESDLDRIGRLFHREYFRPGEEIFSYQGSPDAVYIILSGKVDLLHAEDRCFAHLSQGDAFGEEALLFDDPRYYRAVSQENTHLLRLDVTDYELIYEDYPEVEDRLDVAIRSRSLSFRVNLSWLQDNEYVHVLTRRHPAVLWGKVLVPSILTILLVVFSLLLQTRWLPGRPYGWILLAVGVFTGILWVLWRVIDWRNDFFIVTNKRVVWIEKVALIYESRQEAPLRTIMSVDLQHTRLGGLIGFADVVVNTYVGTIRLRDLEDAEIIASLIESYWHASKSNNQREESQLMEQILGEKLGSPWQTSADTRVRRAQQVNQKAATKQKEPGFLVWLFSDFIRLRYEEDGAIIYRKHWFVLVRHIWLPLLIFLLGLGAAVGFLGGALEIVPINFAFAILVVIFFLCFIWITYQYADWRNDIYKITHDQIIDVDRKPLGKIRRRSAPLENILSIEYERLGFWGFLFNFGTVSISVGNVRLTFDYVYQPSDVQQDIFYRMGERLESLRQFEIDSERERISEWIATYHRGSNQSEDTRKSDTPGKNGIA